MMKLTASKVNDWDSSEDERDVAERKNATARTLVLAKMFTLAELDEDPSLLLDLKQDVREECESLGTVTNVILWDKEPEGLITVRFADVAVAHAALKKMDGRYFAGRRIHAMLIDKKPKYRRTTREDDDDERAEAFGDWLERGDDA